MGLTPDVPGILPTVVVLVVVVVDVLLAGACCCAIAVRARHAAVMMVKMVRFMLFLGLKSKVKGQMTKDVFYSIFFFFSPACLSRHKR